MSEVVCNACKIGKLQARQCNYEEAIFLCDNENCTWPLDAGEESLNYIVKRKYSDINLAVTLPPKRQKIVKPVENEIQPLTFDEDSLDHLLNSNPLGQEVDLSEIFGENIACSDGHLDTPAVNGTHFNAPALDDALLDFSFLNVEDFGIAIPDTHALETPAIGPAVCDSLPTRVAEQRDAVAVTLSSRQPQVAPTLDDICKTTSILNPEKQSILLPGHPRKMKRTFNDKAKSVKIVAKNGEGANENKTKLPCDMKKELEVEPLDERGSVEACLCLLVNNRHIPKIIAGTFTKKLLLYHASRMAEINSPNKRRSKGTVTWPTIRRGCVDILEKRKNSRWKVEPQLPACALSEFLKTPSALNKLFECDVRSEISCTRCEKKTVSIDTKTIHVMDKVPDNFTVTNACCFTECNKCGANNQRKAMAYYMLPDVLAIQFRSGLPERSITSFDFVDQGKLYKVTVVVQHQAKKDHFFAWTRNHNDDSWVCHDSIHNQPAKCDSTNLDVPPAEFHLLIWEKCDPSTGREISRTTLVSANNLKTPKTSQSVPISPRKTLPPSLRSPVMSAELKLPHAVNPVGLTYSISKKPGNLNFFSRPTLSNRHQAKAQSSDELDDLLPSPSSSETSNASDGDVTIANSSFFVPLRNNRITTEKTNERHPWMAEDLVANQRNWTKFIRQPQKRMGRKCEAGKQRRKTTPKKPLPVVRQDPVQAQKLLAGIEIFLN